MTKLLRRIGQQQSQRRLTWPAVTLGVMILPSALRQPTELDVFSVTEFVLAPNNLPWSAIPGLMRNALVPRLVLQAVNSGSVTAWVQCVVLLGSMLVVLLGAIQGADC